MHTEKFQQIIKAYYKGNKRNFPWRETKDFYQILVSEFMLQQTQTSRVLPKYNAFLARFPTLESLAHAKLSEVLSLWSGLGYNRRALYLQKTAQILLKQYHGKLPLDIKNIQELPGIGKYTAPAVLVFSQNQPLIVIETNIRRVFIHFFFKDAKAVSDKEIEKFIHKTLDKENPREWYFALMDYGVYLKEHTENPNRKSTHYKKQSRFEGSIRKVRGEILRILLKSSSISYQKLQESVHTTNDMYEKALMGLEKDGIITKQNNTITIR